MLHILTTICGEIKIIKTMDNLATISKWQQRHEHGWVDMTVR